MTNLEDVSLNPLSGDKPKSLVVLLHGYGDSGNGLIALGQYWREALPDTAFHAPHAPQICEINPMGGYQWFSLSEYTPEKLLEGTIAAHPILNEYLDNLLEKYGISADQMVLVGFSQGTMMSLYTGPRFKDKIAGILGYSGALVGAEDLDKAHKLPIHLIHGEDDSVVPVESYHQAVDILGQNSFNISGYTQSGLEHSIDEEGLQSGLEFINELLK
ncbi:MAG: phospholipase [Pseudomonadota bacterium]